MSHNRTRLTSPWPIAFAGNVRRRPGDALGGGVDIANNGLSVQNGLRVVGGTLGVAGNLSGIGGGATAAEEDVENCLSESGGCFFPGTPVATEFGLKPIEQVRADHLVWSLDLVTGQWRYCRVIETYETEYVGEKIRFDLGGEWIESTCHHPVWVVEGENLDERPRPAHVRQAEVADATVPGRWVDACDLRVGDELFVNPSRRNAAILEIKVEPVAATVYNFQVEELHNYAVGFAAVLVHNNAPCSSAANAIEQHHLLPNQFAQQFADAGLNPENFKIPLTAAQHRLLPDGIHTGPSGESWNGVWKSFLKSNPSADQILDQLAAMRAEFGI
jgi:hypothetical protein